MRFCVIRSKICSSMCIVKFDSFDFYPKLRVKILTSDSADFLQVLTSKTCRIVC